VRLAHRGACRRMGVKGMCADALFNELHLSYNALQLSDGLFGLPTLCTSSQPLTNSLCEVVRSADSRAGAGLCRYLGHLAESAFSF
jgi:hypothetical protein